jgi:aminoglycoside phosphotransferase (APT) family kinase protein
VASEVPGNSWSRRRWPRAAPEFDLDIAAVTRLLQPVFPGLIVRAHERLPGGLINTNIKVTPTQGAPVLLRLYQGDPAQARKEHALCRSLAGRLPVPRFLHFVDSNAVTATPYGLTEWIEGERLDQVVAVPGRDLHAVGEAAGRALAAVHAVTFDTHGFFDADLRIEHPLDFGRAGLLAYLRQTLMDGLGGARLGRHLTEAVLALADREGTRLDGWRVAPCLVHADFNPSNILLRDDADDGCTVAGILDWEFALSGPPGLDFGNLLRPPLGDDTAFADGLAHGYRAAGGLLPDDWRRAAQIADLFAWADIVSRPHTAPAIVDDARRMLRRILDDRHHKGGGNDGG